MHKLLSRSLIATALLFLLFAPTKIAASTETPVSPEAAKLNHRGLEHLNKKEYEQAVASFREALQIQPEYPEALDNLGKALEATGKDAEAITDFDKAIQIAPQMQPPTPIKVSLYSTKRNTKNPPLPIGRRLSTTKISLKHRTV